MEGKWLGRPQVREIYDPEQVELTLFLGSTVTNTTEKTTERILAALIESK